MMSLAFWRIGVEHNSDLGLLLLGQLAPLGLIAFVTYLGLIFAIGPYLVIYTDGIKIRRQYILRVKFIPWESIKRVELNKDGTMRIDKSRWRYEYKDAFKLDIFLKNSQKPLSVTETFVDDIETAYEIIKKHIEG